LVMRNKDIYIISSSNSLKASSEEYVDCFGGIYTHPINKLSSLTHNNSYMIYIIRNPILTEHCFIFI
jgi:hypothetical protein